MNDFTRGVAGLALFWVGFNVSWWVAIPLLIILGSEGNQPYEEDDEL